MQSRVLDDFEDLSGWTVFASGEAELRITPDRGRGGRAMRLDFDFHGGGGFVVARKAFPLTIPERYSFEFQIRGSGPRNPFEFKLVDDSNRNVWRYRAEAFALPEDWRLLRIRDREIEFAWGPLGGGPACHIAVLELVIAAGPGGRGTVSIEDLRLRDDTYRSIPRVSASSAVPGREPENALDPSEPSSWRSEPVEAPQWLRIDFQEEREFGGLVVHWENPLRARRFQVEISVDDADWHTAYSTSQGDSERSYLYLPNTLARYVRLRLLQSAEGRGFGIRGIEVKSHEFSRSLNHFFQSVARDDPPGYFPKYLSGRQTCWTVTGTGQGGGPALLNEEGMVEVDKGSFSIAPFLLTAAGLVTWADVSLSQELMRGYLPIPSVTWRTSGLAMTVTVFAAGEADADRPVLFLRYRLENTASTGQAVALFTAIVPFQVTPTWQNWRSFGGVSSIREISFVGQEAGPSGPADFPLGPVPFRSPAPGGLGDTVAGTGSPQGETGAGRPLFPGRPRVVVNGDKAVVPLTPVSGFGAAAFAEGGVTAYLARGELPRSREIRDEFGYASGALRFDLELPPGSSEEVVLAVPFGSGRTWISDSGEGFVPEHSRSASSSRPAAEPGGSSTTSQEGADRPASSQAATAAVVKGRVTAGADRPERSSGRDDSLRCPGALPGPPSLAAPVSGPLDRTVRHWESVLDPVEIRLPPRMQAVADTFRTAAAHILINRDGPALHPGPRRYSRSWIRDGVLMGAALLRLGLSDPIRDFLRWYRDYLSKDGGIPDCVDGEGSEWLPEFDAYGQFLYAVMEHYRFTGDRSFLEEMRPWAARVLARMEGLRGQRLTEEYQTPEKRGCYGLLPESMSHEGYMAHPVHAYWDDFWALRGFGDASRLAAILGDPAEADRLARLRDEFSEDVRASLRAAISRHAIDYVPGSVEFGDFDPAATSIAAGLLDQLHLLPRPEIDRTFDKYLAGFRERAAHTLDWNNYSAYEVRIVGALVRLGRRQDALDLLAFLLADRRIPAWNQWPEISWRDPTSPSFIGDLPHTWISGEYILAVRALFAFERGSDDSLVIAAGVDPDWLADGFEVGVRNLPTCYGNLSYRMRREEPDTLRIAIEGDLRAPAGGIVVCSPLGRPPVSVTVNGRDVTGHTAEGSACRISARDLGTLA